MPSDIEARARAYAEKIWLDGDELPLSVDRAKAYSYIDYSAGARAETAELQAEVSKLRSECERGRAIAFRLLSAIAGHHCCTPQEGYWEAPQCIEGDINRLVQQAREEGAREMLEAIKTFSAPVYWSQVADEEIVKRWRQRQGGTNLVKLEERIKVRCEELNPALDYLKDK